MSKRGSGNSFVNVSTRGMINNVLGDEFARFMVIVRPFLSWPFIIVFAAIIHFAWPANVSVLILLSSFTVMFSVLVFFLTRQRRALGYIHAVGTTAAIGTILCLVDTLGWDNLTRLLVFLVVPAICLTWAVRSAIRHTDTNTWGLADVFDQAGFEGSAVAVSSPRGRPRPSIPKAGISIPKAGIFRRREIPALQAVNPENAQLPRIPREDAANQITGHVMLPPGATADDALRQTRSMESHAGLPPGSMIITHHPDNARKAYFKVADPRVISNPVEWPGPSYTGPSIADKISVGLYQTSSEARFTLPDLQMQIMGMIGSGKSLGAAWSTLSEIITREDAIVWGIDVTKGYQTLGPFEQAMHRLETGPQGAVELLRDAHDLIKPRTNYLRQKGLGRWKRGCGLQYMVIWLEEVPDIIEATGDEGEAWVKGVKAARSAGMTYAWSLQRSDFTQVPTIARGQSVKWCFGVADTHEASFGLSQVQMDHDCRPEAWGNRKPGMSYLDAPSIPEDRLSIPLRAWYWGEDDSKVSAHADQFPAADRPYDEVTMSVLGKRSPTVTRKSSTPAGKTPEAKEEEEMPENYEDVPDAALDAPESPAELEDDFFLDVPAGEPEEQMPPEEARNFMREWLLSKKGERISNADVTEQRIRTGYKRAWGYKVLREFEQEGLIRREAGPDGTSWTVL